MAYVITVPCHGVVDKGCVQVCPMDCILPGVVEYNGKVYDMMFIKADECIDCGLCETECPVGAIFIDIDVPKKWEHFIELNVQATVKSRDGTA